MRYDSYADQTQIAELMSKTVFALLNKEYYRNPLNLVLISNLPVAITFLIYLYSLLGS